jgi:hypothetical protein
MIRKIIGLMLVLIILFVGFKAISILPVFTDVVIGNNPSPFQVGTSYIDQIMDIYPMHQYQNYGQSTTGNQKINNNILSKVTLEKIEGKLILSIENSKTLRSDLSVWLTNNSEITDKTEYIDFGSFYRNQPIRQYVVDMKGGDISLQEFNVIMIVDKDYKVYKKIILK